VVAGVGDEELILGADAHAGRAAELPVTVPDRAEFALERAREMTRTRALQADLAQKRSAKRQLKAHGHAERAPRCVAAGAGACRQSELALDAIVKLPVLVRPRIALRL
jgi:hypothetical protein